MAEQERVRFEIAFDGGQILGGFVDRRVGRRSSSGRSRQAARAS